jgi:SAM-dependent methyltransferase
MNEHRVDGEDSLAWTRKWTSPEYIAKRQGNFEKVDAYLNQPIKRILDIGCGFAWESRFFQEKYNCELWLLDGDNAVNRDKPEIASYGNWNNDSNNLLFYHSLDYLDQQLKELGTKNYHLIDCNNINISEEIKFDLITSWLSCGHHYPVSVYRDLMLKHSDENTRIVLDLRAKGSPDNFIGVEGFEIVNVITNYGKKRSTVEIKLLKD